MNHSLRLSFMAVVTGLFLSACGGVPTKSDSAQSKPTVNTINEPSNPEVKNEVEVMDAPAQQPSQPQSSASQGVVSEPTNQAAVTQLWKKAEKARKSGDIDGAYAQLEQAVRISPNSPVLWSRMAELRLKKRQYVSSENLASKSNQLTKGRNPLLQYRNWLIIAKAREANGNYAGAVEASKRAQALRP